MEAESVPTTAATGEHFHDRRGITGMTTNPRPQCRHCGKPLREQVIHDWSGYDLQTQEGSHPKVAMRGATRSAGTFGYQGDGKFCTLRCGYAWAMRRA